MLLSPPRGEREGRAEGLAPVRAIAPWGRRVQTCREPRRLPPWSAGFNAELRETAQLD
jgi:hypothetical protein